MSNAKAILPKYCRPRFPNRCVSCGESEPHDTLPIYTSMSFSDVRLSSLWRRHAVEMPVCAGCRAGLLTKRRFMRFSMFVLAVLFVAFLYWAWVIYGGKHEKLFVRLGGLAFIPPLVFFWIMLRMPASMEEEAGKLEYWFDDPEFAREFRELNGIREVESFDFLNEV